MLAALLNKLGIAGSADHSYNALRRLLPTVADILGVDEDQSAAIGN